MKKWPELHEDIRVNHQFLSFFVSAGNIDMKDVDFVMKVNN